jgi:hypothetical protein
VSRIRLSVTEKGEQGASATCTTAPSPASWYRPINRSLSARMASSRWTTLRGGNPPSSSPRLMLPRVATNRMPSLRASSISMSMASAKAALKT